LTLLNPLAMPFAGYLLSMTWSRHRWATGVVTTCAILAGVPSLIHDHRILRGSQADLRIAAQFLERSTLSVYGDCLAVNP